MANTAAKSQRGRDRETDVRDALEHAGWKAFRTASGPVDVVALCTEGATHPVYGTPHFGPFWSPLLIQVKSTRKSPYERFGPSDRQDLISTAKSIRAEAWLVWWPPAKKPQWIAVHEWPGAKNEAT